MKENSRILRIGPGDVRRFFRLTLVAAVATFGLFLSIDRGLLAQRGDDLALDRDVGYCDGGPSAAADRCWPGKSGRAPATP